MGLPVIRSRWRCASSIWPDVAEVLLRERGAEGAVAVARQRSGTQLDPEIVSVFERWAPEILAGLPDGDPWQAALDGREILPRAHGAGRAFTILVL